MLEKCVIVKNSEDQKFNMYIQYKWIKFGVSTHGESPCTIFTAFRVPSTVPCLRYHMMVDLISTRALLLLRCSRRLYKQDV